jgi:hypothetical protein
VNDEQTQQPQDDSQPQEPQPPVDQHPSSTADSESTGGSSPEPSDEEAVEEAAPAAPAPTEGIAPRPEAGSTNPKTAAAPPPGVPLQPINATRDERSAPVPSRPASRIKEAQRRKKEQREENLRDG